jgi:hypothetical protein
LLLHLLQLLLCLLQLLLYSSRLLLYLLLYELCDGVLCGCVHREARIDRDTARCGTA